MASILKFNQAQHTNGTNSYSIGSDGLLRPKVPMFQVSSLDTDQSVSAGTITKLTWATVEVDTASYWDSTNHRYTPSIAGWYQFGGTVRGNFSGLLSYIAFLISKNGVSDGTIPRTQYQSNSQIFTNGEYPMPTGMIYLNGTGDYVEAQIQVAEASNIHDTTSRKSYFWGTLIHAT